MRDMIKNGKLFEKNDHKMIIKRLVFCASRLHVKVTNKGKTSNLSSDTNGEVIMKASIERKLPQHLSALSVYKTSLERRIAEEMKKRLPCTLTLQRLKKQRLDTKDRMAELHRWMDRMTALASS